MNKAKAGEYLPAVNTAGFSSAQNTSLGVTCWPDYQWHPYLSPWQVIPVPYAAPYVVPAPASVTVSFRSTEGELVLILKALLEAVEKKVIDQETLVKILELVKDK